MTGKKLLSRVLNSHLAKEERKSSPLMPLSAFSRNDEVSQKYLFTSSFISFRSDRRNLHPILVPVMSPGKQLPTGRRDRKIERILR